MLCRVDLADVFTGRRTARWALGFVERVLIDPQSVTRALIRGGPDHWPEWFGWSATTARVLENSNVALAVAGGKQFIDPPEQKPVVAESLEDVARRFMT